ncbi:MAG: BACON domain-containing protein [Bryobacteraceae bacterium]
MFAGASYLDWADHSSARSMIAVLSYVGGLSNSPALMLYGDEFLGFSSSRLFPKYRVGTTDYQANGRFVFWGPGGGRLYVFSRLATGSGVLNDTFATLVTPNIGTAGCTATLSGSAATTAAGGESGSFTVTAGDACNWTAASAAAWLRVSAGTFGVGTGSVLFTADRNPYALARSATITAGGQTFTVSQAGGPAVTAPTLAGVTPGTVTGATQALTITARDLDGAANVSRVYFQIGAASLVNPNGCHGFYERANNGLYLYNDALTALLGPVTAGAAGTVQNGQCKIDGSGSGLVQATGTDLVVSVSLTLQGSYTNGTQKVYFWITDNQAYGTGWVQGATWTAMPANVAPQVVSGTPNPAIGASQTFQFLVRDQNGVNDLYRVYFQVNGSPAVPQNTCHGFYERASNAFYLYNDALTALLGPLSPGGGGTLQNSQCELSGSATAVTTASSTDLQLTMGMRLQGSYTTGSRNVYLWARDNRAADTGWVQTGTWAAVAGNRPPIVVSGAPAAMTTAAQTLTFVTRDPDGFANLSRIYFLINSDLTIPANTCHGFYDRASNAFFLYSDGLSILAGPQTGGAAGAIQNSQCKIDGSLSNAVSASGTDLTFTIRFEMRGSYLSGPRKVAVWATDAQGNGTGWVETGTWNVSGGSGPAAPTLVSVTPATATASSQTFAVTARDLNGYTNLSRVYFLVHSTTAILTNGCHGFYDRSLNAVYLYDDTLTQLKGPLTPGAAGTVENSQCGVNGTGLSATGTGNDLQVNLPVTLKGSYLIGTRNVQFWVTDQDSLGTGWQTGSVWTAGVNQTPAIVSGTPAIGGANLILNLGVLARDANGAADFNRVYFVLNSSPTVPVNSCHGFYERASNRIYLYNDSLTQLVPNWVQPGVSGTIQNSQCSIDGAASSVTASGNDLTLSIRFTKQVSWAGISRNVYWWAVDNAATGTGWVLTTTW